MGHEPNVRIRPAKYAPQWRARAVTTNETFQRYQDHVGSFGRASIYGFEQRYDPFMAANTDFYGTAYGWTHFDTPITNELALIMYWNQGDGYPTFTGPLGFFDGTNTEINNYRLESTGHAYLMTTDWIPTDGVTFFERDGNGSYHNDFVTPGSINWSNQPDHLDTDPHVAFKMTARVKALSGSVNGLSFQTFVKFIPDGKTYYGIKWVIECPVVRKKFNLGAWRIDPAGLNSFTLNTGVWVLS